MIELKMEFTKNGKPIIRVDNNTYFSFGNCALSDSGPWDRLALHGFYEVSYKGISIKERVSEAANLNRIQFKNKTKKCIDKEILSFVISTVKKYVNEHGKIPTSFVEEFQKEIETPFELKTKKVKKSKEILFTPEGEVIKKKRGRPKKTV